jgi:hypothetical protein
MVVATGAAEAADLTAAVVAGDFMEAAEVVPFMEEVAVPARLTIPVADPMDGPEDTVLRGVCRDTAADRMDDPAVMVLRVEFRDTAVGPPVWAEREQEQVRHRAALAVRRRAAEE